jgi:hypothetical protein
VLLNGLSGESVWRQVLAKTPQEAEGHADVTAVLDRM